MYNQRQNFVQPRNYEQSMFNPWDSVRKSAFWMKKHRKLVDQTIHVRNEQIVFIGDSLTAGWDRNGKDVWTMYYANRHAYNYGIGGDRTQHVIYRIKNKALDGLKPKVSIVMIGTNNLMANTVEDIAKGVKEVLNQISIKMPTSKVLLLAVLPRPEPLGAKAKELNKLIAKLGDEKTVFYLDMWLAFEDREGMQNTELYMPDKLHLSTAGYVVWHQTMEPLLVELLQ